MTNTTYRVTYSKGGSMYQEFHTLGELKYYCRMYKATGLSFGELRITKTVVTDITNEILG